MSLEESQLARLINQTHHLLFCGVLRCFNLSKLDSFFFRQILVGLDQQEESGN